MQPVPPPGSVTPAAPPPPRPGPRPLRRVGAVAGVIVLAAALFVGGIAADRAGLVPVGPGAPTASVDPDLALVDQAWTLLHEHYVDRSIVDWRQVAYGAIGGMTQAIGDVGHTTFLTPQDLSSLQAELSGSYVGIGAVIDARNGRPEIVSVFQGSSAADAGLKHGDLILSIDGVDTTGMALSTVSSRIRGKAGTTVTLVVATSADGPKRTVTVTRAKVEVPAVSWAMVPGTTVADIQIAQFSTGAADAFGKALDAATQAGASAILLDLRDDPGGYTDEVVGVASRLLASGVVYITQDASGKKTSVSVRSGVQATSLPVVALVNGATASAAEILAGALQDHDRARIVGVTTFGTGTVLLQYALADGSALEIGTEKWLTPSGHQIWHHGITPDQVVALPSGTDPLLPGALRSMTAAEVAASGDAQLQAGLSLLTHGT